MSVQETIESEAVKEVLRRLDPLGAPAATLNKIKGFIKEMARAKALDQKRGLDPRKDKEAHKAYELYINSAQKLEQTMNKDELLRLRQAVAEETSSVEKAAFLASQMENRHVLEGA
jgi:thioredoxin-like negative regulator of GroEL